MKNEQTVCKSCGSIIPPGGECWQLVEQREYEKELAEETKPESKGPDYYREAIKGPAKKS